MPSAKKIFPCDILSTRVISLPALSKDDDSCNLWTANSAGSLQTLLKFPQLL